MDNKANNTVLKRRKIHDPRLYRALLAMLNNPKTTLLDALTIGGFVFPAISSIGKNSSTYSVPDFEGVLLGERKIHLLRVLREARKLIKLNRERDKTIGSTSAAAVHDAENTYQSSIFTYCNLRAEKNQYIEQGNINRIILTFPHLDENSQTVSQSPSSAYSDDNSNLRNLKSGNKNTHGKSNIDYNENNMDATSTSANSNDMRKDPKSKEIIDALGSCHTHVPSNVKISGQSSFEQNKLESPKPSSTLTCDSKKKKRRLIKSHVALFPQTFLDESEGATDGESVDTCDILSGNY